MATPLRLHDRIVVPFGLVALAATGVVALVALSVTTRAMGAHEEERLRGGAAVLERSDFALNPSILRAVRAVTGAHVVTWETGGAILATTFDAGRSDLLRSVTAPEVTREALAAPEGAMLRRDLTCDLPCFAVYRKLSDRRGTLVALVRESSEIREATRATSRAILVAAGLSLVAMIAFSRAVARRVTAPLERLVAFARGVSPTGSAERAPVGEDEIGRLGVAFNEMLDRLELSRDALLRSEKLAVAGLLAARVAHDVRNPLSGVKLQTQMLHDGLRDPEQRSLAAAALRDIEEVERVVRDLLELARPGALARQLSRIEEVVGETLAQLGPRLEHRKIVTVTDLAPNLPGVDLDRGRFKLALANVILNAADAMPTGGTLSVSARAMDAGVEIEVCDDGIGVDPAAAERVFDPFYSTKTEGVGLGLVNARAVVRSHGGRIVLSPRLPRGTCVTIGLPAGPAGRGASRG
jgi:two-component system, NtrC family, sensor kinase